MGKYKKTKDSKASSGTRKTSRLNKQIMRLKMKITRWERYTQEIKKGDRVEPINKWNTSGLKKHMELLENLI